MLAAHGEPNPFDPTIAPNAGSLTMPDLLFGTFEQRLQKTERSFSHGPGHVFAKAAHRRALNVPSSGI